jgi:hypothetical protein
MRRLLLLLIGLLLQVSLQAATTLYMPVQFIIEKGDYDRSMVIVKKTAFQFFQFPVIKTYDSNSTLKKLI